MSRSPVIVGADDLYGTAAERLDAAEAAAAQPIGAWADEHLFLPRGSGITRHQQSITPFWRHWFALVHARLSGISPDHEPGAAQVEQIYLVCSAQVGKTAGFLLVLLAWLLRTRPRDLAVILPSEHAQKKFARGKLRELFDANPELADLLPAGQAAREKRTGTSAWFLDRCTMHLKNGAVALQLRGDDLPLMLFDEFDALPVTVGNPSQGSPLALGIERQKSFAADRLLVALTTPTTVDALGWATLCSGSHERLLIACAGCGAHHWLDHRRLRAISDDLTADAIRREDLARWHCPTCDHAHDTSAIDAAIQAATAVLGWSAAGGWCPGRWEPDEQGGGTWEPDATRDAAGRISRVPLPRGIVRTGWINAMYSTRFVTLGQFQAREIEFPTWAPGAQQAHANNWRAEPWSPVSVTVSGDEIQRLADVPAASRAGYQLGQCPVVGGILALSCDQQGSLWESSWFPWVLRLWLPGGDSWLIDTGKAPSPAALDLLLSRTWSVGGTPRPADKVTIDTANGPLIRHIRQWCAKESRRRISISGNAGFAPDAAYSVLEASQRNAHKLCGLTAAYYYNANLFRDALYDRIRAAPGAPAWRIPSDAPDWYRDSLVSEERLVRDVIVKGRRSRAAVWQPRAWTDTKGIEHVRGDNHWWDVETQGLAAATILGWARAPRTPLPTAAAAAAPAGDWMNGYT